VASSYAASRLFIVFRRFGDLGGLESPGEVERLGRAATRFPNPCGTMMGDTGGSIFD
jgi:hypothetical protein